MPFERLSIPEGHVVPPDPKKIENIIERLMLANFHIVERLMPGEYDLTPEVWTRNTHLHRFIVLDNDSGLYRIIPKSEVQDAGYIDTRDETLQHRPGGTTVRVPQDRGIVVVMGGDDNGRIRVHEVVIHHD